MLGSRQSSPLAAVLVPVPVQVAVDRADDVGRADRGEDVEGVLGAGEFGVDHGALGPFPQARHELTGLVDGDEAVVGAVDDEEVGGVGGDPQDRAGVLVELGGVLPTLLDRKSVV